MHDAHVREMQVQMWKLNTWGVTIAAVTIEEGEQFVADGGVYNLIYTRQTEGVFRVVFVKISVINAHSPFFILFLNENRVC